MSASLSSLSLYSRPQNAPPLPPIGHLPLVLIVVGSAHGHAAAGAVVVVGVVDREMPATFVVGWYDDFVVRERMRLGGKCGTVVRRRREGG